MTSVNVDISADEDDEAPVAIAPDIPGGAYEVTLAALTITINYTQMQRLYLQLRPWFEDDTQ